MAENLSLDVTEFDVIVIGTSLVGSLVAGACSRIGKKVLHFDKNNNYGANNATLTLQEFINEVQPKIKGNFELLKLKERRFNFDLLVKLIYSASSFIKTLIKTKITHYIDFLCVGQGYMYIDQTFKQIPCSKADVFRNKHLGLLEKRKLMKFITTCQAVDQLSPEILESNFFKFIQEQDLSDQLRAFILYSICLLNTEEELQKTTVAQGLKALQIYISSIGRYGPNPFLYPIYGTCEIAQAFCRVAAVNQALYVLRRSITEINVDENNIATSVKCTIGQNLKTNHLVIEPTILQSCLPTSTRVLIKEKIVRCIAILNQPIFPNSAFIVIPPNTHPFNNHNPIQVLQFDSTFQLCPKPYVILHLSMTCNANQTDFNPVFDMLNEIVEIICQYKVEIESPEENNTQSTTTTTTTTSESQQSTTTTTSATEPQQSTTTTTTASEPQSITTTTTSEPQQSTTSEPQSITTTTASEPQQSITTTTTASESQQSTKKEFKSDKIITTLSFFINSESLTDDSVTNLPKNVHIYKQVFNHASLENEIEEATKIFNEMYPGEEFYPEVEENMGYQEE
eukprot:TRINITY_DN2646_c0_g1_i2.p1 TRINITY_DN2646_c0_g1~~TRINITY_DN2646_c0_g1_i2.p1  ORF type:complete len:568 (-),score=243.52 TRINITY_DN2646_c0_g1_i2:76-1779(-)